MVSDIQSQNPELDITYKMTLQLLREHNMIRKFGTLPLKKLNNSVPFRLKTGGDGSGNRVTYLAPTDIKIFIQWFAAQTNQLLD